MGLRGSQCPPVEVVSLLGANQLAKPLDALLAAFRSQAVRRKEGCLGQLRCHESKKSFVHTRTFGVDPV